jgi:PAP2 superfamily protein
MAKEPKTCEAELSSAANVIARASPHSRFAAFGRGLRPAEKIALGFLTYALFAAPAFHLSLSDIALIAGLNFTAAIAVILLSELQKTSSRLSLARDWFPAVLVLLAYRESGLFLQPDPSHYLDYVFVSWDRYLLHSRVVDGLLTLGSPWLQYYFELSYLLCYPLVPLGMGLLYLAGHSATDNDGRKSSTASDGVGPPAEVGEGLALPRKGECSVLPRKGQGFALPRKGACSVVPTKGAGSAHPRFERGCQAAINQFWTAVLLATLTCYALYPLFPLTPPRVLFHDLPGPTVEPLLRKVNFWILDRYSVQACIFPSGHVAAVTAVALSLRAHLPRWGGVFLFVATSVALATVYGRYHYAADAVAGALLGVGAFLLSRRIRRVSWSAIVGPSGQLCRENRIETKR